MNFIGEYVVPPAICDGVTELFYSNRSRASAGSVGTGYVDLLAKESEDLAVDDSIGHDPAIQAYYSCLNKCIEEYKRRYKYCAEGQEAWGISEPPNIQLYPPGGGFKVYHYEKTASRSIHLRRHLVFMTYLCDIPPEEGGGTEFLYQDKAFECRKGSTLIWPAEWTHTHRGIISDNREKMIITGWYSYIRAPE